MRNGVTYTLCRLSGLFHIPYILRFLVLGEAAPQCLLYGGSVSAHTLGGTTGTGGKEQEGKRTGGKGRETPEAAAAGMTPSNVALSVFIQAFEFHSDGTSSLYPSFSPCPLTSRLSHALVLILPDLCHGYPFRHHPCSHPSPSAPCPAPLNITSYLNVLLSFLSCPSRLRLYPVLCPFPPCRSHPLSRYTLCSSLPPEKRRAVEAPRPQRRPST